MPVNELAEIKKQIEELQSKGFIHPVINPQSKNLQSDLGI
jgi:hypothetical protein